MMRASVSFTRGGLSDFQIRFQNAEEPTGSFYGSGKYSGHCGLGFGDSGDYFGNYFAGGLFQRREMKDRIAL
jgi:hypothetical protein